VPGWGNSPVAGDTCRAAAGAAWTVSGRVPLSGSGAWAPDFSCPFGPFTWCIFGPPESSARPFAARTRFLFCELPAGFSLIFCHYEPPARKIARAGRSGQAGLILPRTEARFESGEKRLW